MKKTKFSKIFVLILSLALLIGSAVGIAASAETAEDANTYAIKAMNVAYGDRFQVVVAVDVPVEDAEGVEVTYNLNGTKYWASLWKVDGEIQTTTIKGVTYPLFYTHGIAAKYGGDDIFIEAHTAGLPAAEYTPEYKNVNIALYLNTLLYKGGAINATEGEALDKKNLYLDCYDYIASAQEVLWNFKHPGEEKTLVTDMNYVSVTGGLIEATTTNSGMYAGSGLIKLVYTGEGAHDGWYATRYVDGVAVESGVLMSDYLPANGTYVITGNYVQDNSAAFFNDLESLEAQVVFESRGVGSPKYTQFEYTNNIDAFNAVSGKLTFPKPYLSTNMDASNRATNPGALFEIADEKGNKVINLKNGNRDNVGGADNARGISFNTSFVDEVANPNVAVYQIDIRINAGNEDGLITQLGFTDGDGTQLYPYVYATQNSIGFNKDATVQAHTVGYQGGFYTIRVEYYWELGVAQYYVNGGYVGDVTYTYNGKHTMPKTVSFGMDSRSDVDVTIDNVTAKRTRQIYVENPSYVAGFDDCVTNDISWVCSNGTWKTETAEGGALYGQYELDYEHTATDYHFGPYVTVKHGASGNISSKGECDYANTAGAAKVNLLTDSLTGNKYVNLTTPGRISKQDRAYSISIAPSPSSGAVSVVEFDMKVDSVAYGSQAYHAPFNILMYAKNGTYAQWDFKTKNYDAITLNGVSLGAWDEWNSLRFEFYDDTADRDAEVKIYRRNAEGVYEYIGSWVNYTSGTQYKDENDNKLNYTDLNYMNQLSSISIGCTNGNISINFDNVIMYYADIPYVAE